VETAQHMAYLRPLQTGTQRLLSHRLVVDPVPVHLSESLDVFGNLRTFFSLQTTHRHLTITAESVVDTRQASPIEGTAAQAPWEASRDLFRYQAGQAYNRACEFVFGSPCAPRHQDFLDYARPSFVAGTPLLTAVDDLMSRIHADFSYVPQSTEVSTPAQEALAQKKGVCQDFSHVMIACLRSIGLPARYVSGYLLTELPEGQPRLIGADASHAWVSVYFPGLKAFQRSGDVAASGAAVGTWVDFCPTNKRRGPGSPGEDYVTLARGRDYVDVSPMRGMIHGGAHHLMHVGVTVEPVVDESDSPSNSETTTSNTP
jgi:transglutaminase-like putative cysteine protease